VKWGRGGRSFLVRAGRGSASARAFELSRWRGGRCACDTAKIMGRQSIPIRKPVSSDNSLKTCRLQVRVDSNPIA
jgi:hypothetical protein